MKTFSAKPAEVKRDWYVIDADGKTLGRMSTEIARRLRGKHKAEYTPHVDTGDYIIVINAEKVRVTGNKEQDKIYYKHTGYIGNMKSVSLGKLRGTHPERIIQTAVKGMLPKNPLGRAMFKKLKVYAGIEHGQFRQKRRARVCGAGARGAIVARRREASRVRFRRQRCQLRKGSTFDQRMCSSVRARSQRRGWSPSV